MKPVSLILYAITLVTCNQVLCVTRDTSGILKARQKRTLIYQSGTNWVQMVIGIGFPVALPVESVTWGVTLKSYYILPTNSSDYLRPSIDISRKSRSPSRWEIYSSMKKFMDRFNMGSGKSCLLRAICEASLAPFEQRTGIFAEIMHVLLTPSSTEENTDDYTDLEYHAAEKLGRSFVDCSSIFSDCNNYHIIEKLTKFLY